MVGERIEEVRTYITYNQTNLGRSKISLIFDLDSLSLSILAMRVGFKLLLSSKS